MKIHIIIIAFLVCFISCKNKTITGNTIWQQADNLDKPEWPNKETHYDTLTGNNDTSRISEEVKNLIEILKKGKFTVTINKQLTTPLDITLYEENKIIILKDVYTLKLFARSTISDKRMQNTFPDFTVYEMNFKSEQDAEQVIKWHYISRNQLVTEAKYVDKAFSKGNKVYYFTTRAEMFRNYINEYAYFVKSN